MKIAFDEHIPPGMAEVFQTLAKHPGFQRRTRHKIELVKAKDYAPNPGDSDYQKGSDVPWLERYANDNGRVIISGDSNMIDVPHELLAIQRRGLIAVFFPARWNNWSFQRKSSLLLWHWEAIIRDARKAKPGSLLRIPMSWTADAKITRIQPPGPRITQRQPRGAKKPPKKPPVVVRKRSAAPDGQGDLGV